MSSEITILQDEHGLLELAESFDTQLTEGMSAYQITHFVLSDLEFPTPDSKYYQCLREMRTRYESIVSLEQEYLDLQDEIALLGLEIEEQEPISMNGPNSIEAKRADIRMQQAQRKQDHKRNELHTMEKRASEVLRELQVFYDLYTKLKGQRKYDSHEAAEAETWRARFQQRLQMGQFDQLPPIPEARELVEDFQRQRIAAQQQNGNIIPARAAVPQGNSGQHPLQ